MPDDGPWTKYGGKPDEEQGPWAKYGATAPTQAVPAALPPGSMQTRKGGPIVNATDAEKDAKDQERAGIEAAERATAPLMAGGELGMGAMKGAFSTGRHLGGLLTKLPWVGPKIAAAWPEAVSGPSEAMKPHGFAQKAGLEGEQLGEFLLPGAGEEKAGLKLANVAPQLGKFAAPLGRTLYGALTTGAIGKAHGGNFGENAALGAGFGGASEAAREFAPKLAETALRVNERMRGRGRTIGEAVLDETKGLSPKTIAAESGNRIAGMTGNMEDAVHAATLRGAQGSTQPAHDVLDEAIKRAPRNAKELIDKLKSLREVLSLTPGAPGAPTQIAHTPDELLELKRGIDKTIQTWGPEWQRMKDVQRVKQQLYGAIDKEIDRLVPGNAEINQRISSLIPANSQAKRISSGAPFSQRMAHRMAAHTGALAGGVGGGLLGYREGGARGALLGTLAGIAGPELVSSPTVQMGVARGLRSGAPMQVGRGLAADFFDHLSDGRELKRKEPKP